jgi:hypothetical protein
MSGIPRMPRDSDPRSPRKQPDDARELSGNPPRSYGQSADVSDRKIEEMEKFEDLTDEVVREGDDEPSGGDSPSKRKQDRKLREFEDLAGEPVMDDDDKSG